MNNIKYTVFFGGLTQNVTTDNLQQWTELFGDVSNIKIIPNKKNPTGLNFGFVDMEDKETMLACIEYYKENPLEVEGVKLTIAQAKRNKENKNNFNNRRSSQHRNDYRSDRRTSSRYNNFNDNDGLHEYEAHRSNRSYNRYND